MLSKRTGAADRASVAGPYTHDFAFRTSCTLFSWVYSTSWYRYLPGFFSKLSLSSQALLDLDRKTLQNSASLGADVYVNCEYMVHLQDK